MNDLTYPYRVRLPYYIGSAVRDMRREKKMTQSDLADITGTSVKFISDLERGKESVQMDKAFDLLRALGLHIYLVPADREE